MAKNYRKVVDRGCWIWFGAKKDNGYVQITRNGKHMYAHRAMYEFFREPIPPGMVIDHLCRNRACLNPIHMEVVDHGTNLMRGETEVAKRAAQTMCKRGHPLSGANLGIIKNGNGRRYCKKCRTAFVTRDYWLDHGVKKTIEECLSDSERRSIRLKNGYCLRGHKKNGVGCHVCSKAQQRMGYWKKRGVKKPIEHWLQVIGT